MSHEDSQKARDAGDGDVPDFGRRLRALRQARSLTIDGLSRLSGLSRAYLSQLETGKASPSLQTVRKLCSLFGVSASHLIDPEPPAVEVLRADDQPVVLFGALDVPLAQRKQIRFLSAAGRTLELVVLQIPAGYATETDDGHEGEEVFYVLDGEIIATVDGRSQHLSSGDSLHIDSRTRHALRNASSEPARIVVARTPPGFIEMRFDNPSPSTATRDQKGGDAVG